MTQSEISHFLQDWIRSGAFCRGPAPGVKGSPGPFHLERGPFRADPDGHLMLQEFFGPAQSWKGDGDSTLSLTEQEFREGLQDGFSRWRAENPETLLRASDFQEPDFERYRETFQFLQGELDQGVLRKAVPVAISCAPKRSVSIGDRWAILLRMLDAPASLYPYGYWDAEEGMLGLSPEILFHRQGANVETMAVAGTLILPSGISKEQFLRDPKEQSEHRFVIEDIRQQLTPFGPVEVGETSVKEFPTLAHLVTPLFLHLPSPWGADGVRADAELTRRLHPTSALGLYPRSFGLEFLKKLPSQSARKWHGAPICFRLGPDETLALVAIRCLQWDTRGAFVVSGGGVVKESQLEREWREILHKRDAVFRSLGLGGERQLS